MKVILRITLSVISMMLILAITDYYFQGLIKTIVWGLTMGLFFIYNQKNRHKQGKEKDINQ
ncbi:hypothetical protein DZB84_15190 [Bacillus sp. HNG]|uniref:hypothetical protein n=1 Tax=Bacillus sp. HNG TaxID=2293325 RepID=UPI000E2ECBEA|nr:hypothetical protein [Bacillus sp. HNG]RFB14784.1 hypothetical protein DZB84_15190 [Bacillus sp. HNG]